MNWLRPLQKVIYFIGTLGILVGLDLLLGAKINSNLKRILDKTILDVDKIVVKISSSFRKTVDTSINIDDKIINKTKARIIVGFLLTAVSAVMIFLAKKG